MAILFTALLMSARGGGAAPPAKDSLSTPGPAGNLEQIEYLQNPIEHLPQQITQLESEFEKARAAPAGYEADRRRGCLKLALTGLKALRAGDQSGAESFLSQAQSLNCASEAIGFYLAWSIASQSRYSDVVGLLGKNEKPCGEDVYLKPFCESILGRSYFLTGNYQSSLPYLSSVATQYPRDLPHRFFWGEALMKTGAKDEGVTRLSEVLAFIDTTPNADKIAVRICEDLSQYFLLEQNNPERARVFVVEGLKRAPNHPKLRALLKQIDGRLASPQTNTDVKEFFRH